MSALLTAWRHTPSHRRVWALAAPMILSNLTVPLVTLVDTTVIGHLPHAHQLGAVVVGSSLYAILVGVFGILRMSATGFAAQACGRGDGAALRLVLVQSLSLALLIALAVAFLALPLSGSALQLMQPSAELKNLTQAFFAERLFGLPATLICAALIGWLLGAQNARAALGIMLCINLINIALNLWFVLGLDWGVLGSARASVIAEWCGACLGLGLAWRVLQQHQGTLPYARLRHWRNWQALLAVNRDIFIRTLTLHLVFFLITLQGTRLGDSTVAANALLLNGLMITAFALDGLAHALEALCGHALGAQDRTALQRALVVSGGWSLIGSVLFGALFLYMGQGFINLQSDIASVREAAYPFLPYLAVLPLIAVWSYLLDGLFIGATRAREMRNAMLLSFSLALGLALSLQSLGNHGLWLSFLAFMLLRGICLGVSAWRLKQRGAWFAQA